MENKIKERWMLFKERQHMYQFQHFVIISYINISETVYLRTYIYQCMNVDIH